MDYKVLKTELALPAYSGMTDQQAADALNAVNVPIARTTISGDELLENTALGELVALDAAKTAAFWGLAGKDSINVAVGTNTRAILAALFPAGSVTRAALVALLAQATLKSRADILGLGDVTAGDVQRAKAGTY